MNLTLDQKHRLLLAAKHDLLHVIANIEKLTKLRGAVDDAEATLRQLKAAQVEASERYQYAADIREEAWTDKEYSLREACNKAEAAYSDMRAQVDELQAKLREALSNLSFCGVEHAGSVNTAGKLLLSL